MKKCLWLIVLLASVLALLGCEAETPPAAQYLLPSNTALLVESHSSVDSIEYVGGINLTGVSVLNVNAATQSVVLSDSNGCRLTDYKGAPLVEGSYESYTHKDGLYTLYSGGNTVLYNAATKTSYYFESTQVHLMNDGFYAKHKIGTYKIVVCDAAGNEVLLIYDDKTTMDVERYDCYIYYYNVQFSHYQLYNLNFPEEDAREIPATSGSNLYYICNGRFLLVGEDSSLADGWYNAVIDLQTDVTVELETNKYTMVINRYNSEERMPESPYSYYVRTGGEVVLANDAQVVALGGLNGTLRFVEGVAVMAEQRSETEIMLTLYSYDKLSATISEGIVLQYCVDGSLNDGALTYYKIIGGELYGGAVSTDGEALIEENYLYLSSFYKGKAIARKSVGDKAEIIFLDKSGNETAIARDYLGNVTGIYWYLDGNNTVFSTFDGERLLSLSGEVEVTNFAVYNEYAQLSVTVNGVEYAHFFNVH